MLNISNLLLHKILSRGHLLFLGIACSNLLIDVIIQIQDRRKYGVHVLLEADIFGKIDPTLSLHLQYSPYRTYCRYCLLLQSILRIMIKKTRDCVTYLRKLPTVS